MINNQSYTEAIRIIAGRIGPTLPMRTSHTLRIRLEYMALVYGRTVDEVYDDLSTVLTLQSIDTND